MRNGVYTLFENIWSCEDFATTKADPAIYRMAAERIGKPVADIIFLDDNYDADKTAKSAGMRVYGVFDESSREFADDIRSVTDRYITDFSELLEV
jgi:FMN phosphatase YigB (HAD superfamily)